MKLSAREFPVSRKRKRISRHIALPVAAGRASRPLLFEGGRTDIEAMRKSEECRPLAAPKVSVRNCLSDEIDKRKVESIAEGTDSCTVDDCRLSHLGHPPTPSKAKRATAELPQRKLRKYYIAPSPFPARKQLPSAS